MKLKHINKIKTNISIYSNKKTTNLLEGTYKSVYKGKSLNFENLREYVINDDVKDIDWKSSARSGTILVKQFIAEKKHNILLVLDSGIKMEADTEKQENKKEIATQTAGTIGYLAIKNGDYVGLSYYNNENKIDYKPFKENLYNLEEYLCCYESNAHNKETKDINQLLKYIFKNITKRMIIFIITDINGIENISTNTIKQLTSIHDVMIINISDNCMFGDTIFDIEKNNYIPLFFSKDKKLYELEKETKKEIIEENKKRFNKNKVSITTINSEKEITNKIIELLEEHKYANYS